MAGFGVVGAIAGSVGVPVWLALSGISRLELSSEYMHPTKPERQIETVSFNALLGRSLLNGYLESYAGLTFTRPWGEIIQLEGDFNQGTLREVTYSSPAFGAGPSFLFRLNAIPVKPERRSLQLGVDLGGGVLWYDRKFPAGGIVITSWGDSARHLEYPSIVLRR